MDLQQLASILKQQAGSPPHQITLDNATLQRTGLNELIQKSLLREAGNIIITVDPGSIPDTPPASGFSISGVLPTQAKDSFLNLAGNTISIHFVSRNDTIEFQLDVNLNEVNGKTVHWMMGDSFPTLKGTPFEALGLSSSHFIFSTYTPDGSPSPVEQGLNLTSQVDLSRALADVATLLKISQALTDDDLTYYQLHGPISQGKYGPEFDLAATLNIPSIDLNIMVILNPYVGAMLTLSQSDDASFLMTHYMGAEVKLKNAQGTEVPLAVRAIIPYQSVVPMLTVSILPQTDFATSLSNLGRLIGGHTWDDFFSGPAAVLKPYLDTFGLKAFSADISLREFAITSWNLTVGTLSAWTIIEDKVVVNYFDASWQIISPDANAISTIILEGELQLFKNYLFDAYIAIPELEIVCAFKGDLTFSIASLLDDIAANFDSSKPIPAHVKSALAEFTLSQIHLSIDVPNNQLGFNCDGCLTIADTAMEFGVAVAVANGSYELDSYLSVGGALFIGQFTKAENPTIFRASWQASPGSEIGFADIAAAFGFDDPSDIPSSLDLGLKSASFTYDFSNQILILTASSQNYGQAIFISDKVNGKRFFAFGLDIYLDIDLSDIPLIGEKLPPDEKLGIPDVQVLITSMALAKEEVGKISPLITGSFPALPADGVPRGITLQAPLNFGPGQTSQLSLPLSSGTTSTSPPALRGSEGGQTSTSPSDPTKWFNIQKSFGPVSFKRIGVKYISENEELGFALDAAIALGGLTFSMDGLSVSSPLTNFAPHFHLDGLGLSFINGPLEIVGAFLAVSESDLGNASYQYDGLAVIKAASFTLAAVGSYAKVSGQPSLFVFAQIEGAFGGPPFFFVTGLLGGFGYNRRLRIPEQNEVYEFPFIRGLTDPQAIGGAKAGPLIVLDILDGRGTGPDGKPNKPWLTMQPGEDWLAIGIEFTSFQLVKSHALLVVQFGHEFELALIGLATLKLPQESPETYAYVEMQLEAILKPVEGFFGITAVVSPNSFVFDKGCRLTGGFAFYIWFSGEHAGDFVVTLGGYHPSFSVPAWYPREPRLGFNWPVDKHVTIKGEAYFALTPSAVMGGGSLEVSFRAGDLRAWFTAHADFIISWKPFYFIASIGVSIGASYRLKLGFVTKTIKVELGATLDLWGPPTGGKAHVSWYIISFTVSFGKPKDDQRGRLEWSEFKTLLPKDEDVNKIIVNAGLTQQTDDGTWIVRADEFRFSTESAIPSTRLVLGASDDVVYKTGDYLLDIRPMEKVNLGSSHVLKVHRVGEETIDLQADSWKLEGRRQNVPESLWGKPVGENRHPAAKTLPNRLVGFQAGAPDPEMGGTPGPIDVQENLSYAPVEPGGRMPLSDRLEPDRSDLPGEDSHSVQKIVASLTAKQQVRDSIHAVLQELQELPPDQLTNGALDHLRDAAASVFRDPPLQVQ